MHQQTLRRHLRSVVVLRHCTGQTFSCWPNAMVHVSLVQTASTNAVMDSTRMMQPCALYNTRPIHFDIQQQPHFPEPGRFARPGKQPCKLTNAPSHGISAAVVFRLGCLMFASDVLVGFRVGKMSYGSSTCHPASLLHIDISFERLSILWPSKPTLL